MPSTIFAGSKVKTLKDTLTINGKSDIISSTVDPTASAVDAPIGSLLINQTSGKLYRKLDAGSSVNWEEVGSGTGGINYILNPSAEVNTTGWSTYADAAGIAPVDGSGGSPNVTWTRSTTSPLRGVADFNFAKDAANRQGQGVSVDFTIDEADKAKVLSVTFDYEVLSGTYANADLTVYLIADPTGTPVVIQPAGYTVQAATVGTTMRQIATFQTQATGLSYRLCFHVASTSASAYTLAVDNVVVGPQSTVQGAAISDWVSSTPTYSNAGTTSLSVHSTRRVGDTLQIQGRTVFATAGAAAVLRLRIPSSIGTIDTTKVQTGNLAGSVGSYNAQIGGSIFNGNVNLTTTANEVSFIPDGPGGAHLGSAFGLNTELTYTLSVPIYGWSSNTVLSQDTDTRVVAAKANSPSITGFTSTPTNPVLNNKLFDTHSAYNTSTGVYLVPVSGYYKVTHAGRFANFEAMVSGTSAGTYIFKNSSLDTVMGTLSISAAVTPSNGFNWNGSGVVYANAGDTLEIRNAHDMGGTKNLLSIAANGSLNWVSIERLSGPATIAASETVACRYKDSSGANIPGSAGVFKYTTKDYDTHGFYSTTTGLATIPVSGKYSVTASLQSSVQTLGVQQGIILFLYKNGSNYSSLGAMIGNGNGNLYLGYGEDSVQCVAGDTLAVYALWGAGVAVPSNTDSIYNHIAITRVGN